MRTIAIIEGPSAGAKERRAPRAVEIVDTEMRRIAVGIEYGEIPLPGPKSGLSSGPDPRRFIALLMENDGGRSAQAFSIDAGQEVVRVRFDDVEPAQADVGRRWSWKTIAGVCACLAIVGVAGFAALFQHDAAPTKTSANRTAPGPERFAPVTPGSPVPLPETASRGTAPVSRDFAISIARSPASAPAGSGQASAPPPPAPPAAPTPPAAAPVTPAHPPPPATPSPAAVSDMTTPLLFWVAGLATAAIAAGVGGLLLMRRRLRRRHMLAEPVAAGPSEASLAPQTAPAGGAAQAGVATVAGFDLRQRAHDPVTQKEGSHLTFTKAASPAGLSRIEVGLAANQATGPSGIAVMIPLAVGESCRIEFRPRLHGPPHPHIVFHDEVAEQLLKYRHWHRLEAAGEVARNVLETIDGDVAKDRPITATLALYFILRTRGWPLDRMAELAQRLAERHVWLPDAHILAGEIAARRAQHKAAVESFLRIQAIGPPFATLGVTMLSDRLRLYGEHLEGRLGMEDARGPYDRLKADVEALTQRLITARPITTFIVGDLTAKSNIERREINRNA